MPTKKPAAPRGRAPRMVYINVRIKATTRDRMKALTASLGVASQGALLDAVFADPEKRK